jgi:hydrogenase expression/formation protein HypC
MCIAAPAQVVEINRDEKIGFVDFGGVKQQIKLDLVDEIEVGKYVLVHAGYAIEVLSDQAAKESLEAWDELLKVLDEEDEELLAQAENNK